LRRSRFARPHCRRSGQAASFAGIREKFGVTAASYTATSVSFDSIGDIMIAASCDQTDTISAWTVVI
jgi:hypothetical protein